MKRLLGKMRSASFLQLTSGMKERCQNCRKFKTEIAAKYELRSQFFKFSFSLNTINRAALQMGHRTTDRTL